jgi:hypothetical protein
MEPVKRVVKGYNESKERCTRQKDDFIMDDACGLDLLDADVDKEVSHGLQASRSCKRQLERGNRDKVEGSRRPLHTIAH